MFHENKPLFQRIDWVNTLFLTLTPLIALAGAWYFIANGLVVWQTMVLSLFMMIATGLAITMGYHRLFSHKTYKSSKIIKFLLLAFGAAAFQNSARKWSSDHRRHHKYVDTDRDPYNIKRGFFWAHMGWVMIRYDNEVRYDDVPDLVSDPMVMFQEKHYLSLGIGFGFLFPALMGMLWGDMLGAVVFAGFVRTVLNHHFTFFINSAAHMWGSRPYSDDDTSRDNWFFAFFTYGEGYHNFHHKFPFDYRNAIKYFQWDPTKWMIKFCSWFGLTTELKKVPDSRILRARLEMDQKRLMGKIESGVKLKKDVSLEIINATREKFEAAYNQFRTMKTEYVKQKSETLKIELAEAKRKLEEATAAWVELCRGFGVTPTRALV